jgi:hypothetical protein
LFIVVLHYVLRLHQSPKDYENKHTMRRAIPDAGLQRSEVHNYVQ